jgi:ABC-type transport system involved in cytochrome c biogenesis ATPase subunit
MSPSASLNDAMVILDDRPVLRGVSIAIGPGLTVLRGPNGAGKTTLLRALAGLAPLARGSRRVMSAPLFIGQRSMLLRGLSAHQNLTFLATFRGERSADVSGALVRWGLEGLLDRPVERLSAGERHRAALARIDTEPADVVLLDEPFSELDAEGTNLVSDAIWRAANAGRAVLLVTHGHPDLDVGAKLRLSIDAGEVSEK